MRCFICQKPIKKIHQVHPRYGKNMIVKQQFYCELDWQRAGRPLPERIIKEKPRPHICCTSPVNTKHNVKCQNWGDDLSDLVLHSKM